MKNIFIVIVLGILFSGCKKEMEETEETKPLQIRIESPTHGSTVENTVNIHTSIIGDIEISSVDFYVDDVLIETVSEPPYEIDWNTRLHTNGVHSLFCEVKDMADNEVKSPTYQVRVANHLFTANFTNDWLRSDCGEGILFISDKDGNVLAERTWFGNESFTIDLPEDVIYSDNISVTTITRRYRSGELIDLKTYLDVPIGSNWTWKGYPIYIWYYAENVVNFNFVNIPNNSGYIVSSSEDHRYQFESLPSTHNNRFIKSPMDFYLKLNTQPTPKYKWIYDVTAGNRTVDLSALSDLQLKTIDIPTSGVADVRLDAFLMPEDRYSEMYTLDRNWNENVSSVNVYYPPSTFTDFRTSIGVSASSYWYIYWQQVTYGAIPNTFEKITADFSFNSASVDNFKITTTSSDFDMIKSRWYIHLQDPYLGLYWEVFSPPSTNHYKLPYLSNSVLLSYPPSVNRESFQLWNAELIDHSELNTYKEVINAQFHASDYFYDVVNDKRLLYKRYN